MREGEYAVVPVIRRGGRLHGVRPGLYRTRGGADKAAARAIARYVGVMVFSVHPSDCGDMLDLVLLRGYGQTLSTSSTLH